MCEYMWAWLCTAACGAQKSISDSLELNLPAFTSWSRFWEPHSGPNNRAASSLNCWATFPALIETSETFCWKLLWGQWSKTDIFEALLLPTESLSTTSCHFEHVHGSSDITSVRNAPREQLPDGSQRLHLLEWRLTLSTVTQANPQLWIQTSSDNAFRRRCFSREQAQAAVWPVLSPQPSWSWVNLKRFWEIEIQYLIFY